MDLLPLTIALLVLLVDSAIELALISSMVGFLHRSGANQYPFDFNGETFLLNAKPKGLLVDQGHTSNGAAGTCLVAICFGGFIVLWLQRRRARNGSTKPSKLFLAYTILSVLSFLLTTAALAYTFDLTNQTKSNRIDLAVASQVQSHAYPKDHWTPETWTKAMLALPITSETDRSYLRHWVRVMEGWKWNLIPMFLIDMAVTSLIVLACLQDRKLSKASRGRFDGEHVHDKNVAATEPLT